MRKRKKNKTLEWLVPVIEDIKSIYGVRKVGIGQYNKVDFREGEVEVRIKEYDPRGESWRAVALFKDESQIIHIHPKNGYKPSEIRIAVQSRYNLREYQEFNPVKAESF